MIYVTGDIHGNPSMRFDDWSFPEQKEMTKDDYVIICGDFGIIWDWRGTNKEEEKMLDWLEDKSFTTLFVDGNHENHDRLDAYPVEEWHGCKVHKLRPSVIHLMRGQVFDIGGKKFFTFGGAASHDISDGILEPDDPRIPEWSANYFKMFRVNKHTWWDRELPNKEEMHEGLKNLSENDFNVDFVITHCCATSTAALLGFTDDINVLNKYFEELRPHLEYKRWFFGHYHMNKDINGKDLCLYEQIIRIA